MVRLEEGADAVDKAYDIAVETCEDRLIVLACHLYHIDCPYGESFGADVAEVWDDLLLVWDCDIKPAEVGMLSNSLRQLCYGWKLEIKIFGINTFFSKFVAKEFA